MKYRVQIQFTTTSFNGNGEEQICDKLSNCIRKIGIKDKMYKNKSNSTNTLADENTVTGVKITKGLICSRGEFIMNQ